MKILTFLTCAILIAPSAYAASKCVPLNSSTTCTTDTDSYGSPDWTATCTTNGKTVKVKGIVGFGSKSGDTLNVDVSSNGSCYCKMISPAISSWVGMPTPQLETMGKNITNCAYTCMYALTQNSTFMTSLFSNLSD